MKWHKVVYATKCKYKGCKDSFIKVEKILKDGQDRKIKNFFIGK